MLAFVLMSCPLAPPIIVFWCLLAASWLSAPLNLIAKNAAQAKEVPAVCCCRL